MTKTLDLLFRIPWTKPYCNFIFLLWKLAKNKKQLDLSVTLMSQLQSNLRLDKCLSSFQVFWKLVFSTNAGRRVLFLIISLRERQGKWQFGWQINWSACLMYQISHGMCCH